MRISKEHLSGLLWIKHLFSLEIRRVFSYRVDFWIQFIGGALAQIGVAYFLWKAIFVFNNVQQMRGFTFSGLMLYYIMVPLVDRMVRGSEMGAIALEIFEGTLSRYLIYPIQFFLFKYIRLLAQSFIFFINLLFAVVVFIWLFQKPVGAHFSISSFFMGSLAVLFATYLFFILSSIIEMIAFWVEFVWSLLVVLRMIILILGGGMIPLAFFPDIFREYIYYFPFPYLVSFPIRSFWGVFSFGEWLSGIVIIILWSLIFSLISYLVWKRGLKEFTGVGI